jgi:hypothetical protein
LAPRPLSFALSPIKPFAHYMDRCVHADFPAYSDGMAVEWCASRGEPRGCALPTARERSAPNVGNSFLTSGGGDRLGSGGGGTGGGAGNGDRGSLAVAFANFTARTVARTIATLCASAKAVSGGNLFTFAFYGYLINSATNVQFSGHAAADFLLSHRAIDAIASPPMYSAASRAPEGGGLVTHGPWNAPAARHGKLWMVESDLRTALANSADEQPYRFGTDTLEGTCDVLRRFVWTAAINGNGLYMFDLVNRGWFGRPANRTAGEAIWRCIASARDALQRALAGDDQQAMLTSQPTPALEPRQQITAGAKRPAPSPAPSPVPSPPLTECFLFIDEPSVLHWPVSGPLTRPLTSAADRMARKEWIHALMQQALLLLPSLGAPFRVHLLSDLLGGRVEGGGGIKGGGRGLDLRAARLVVFANAYRIGEEQRGAIRERLHGSSTSSSQPTLVFFHAPGVLDGEGRLDPSGPARLLGAPLRVEADEGSLETTFGGQEGEGGLETTFGGQEGAATARDDRDLAPSVPPVPPVQVAAGAPARAGGPPDLTALRGQTYSDLATLLSPACPGCPTRIGGITQEASRALVSPWLSCAALQSAAANCTVLGRSTATGLPTLCWCQHAAHRTLFSASPGLPLAAWRAVARAASVHVWADGAMPGAGPNGKPAGAFVDIGHVSAHRSLAVARVSTSTPQPQPPRTSTTATPPPDASRFRLPRAARVTDALSGARLCDSCTDFVDPLLPKSTRTYILDWHHSTAAEEPGVSGAPR